MSKRLMPTYLVEFLKNGYNGDIPTNFGQRMVSRQAIAFTKKLFDIFAESNAPVNFGRSMLPEYLVKFLDDLRSSDFIVFEDDDIAFIKNVPDISDISCKINIIGGMSYKSENLIVLSDVAETTVNGIKWKIQDDSIILDGTATANTSINLSSAMNILSALIGTFSFNLFNESADFAQTIQFYIEYQSSANRLYLINGSSVTANKSGTAINLNWGSELSNFIYIVSGATFNNFVIKPMLVSGSTVPTEWKQGFTGIRDSALTSVVSKDSSNNTVDTITIDASIQALEGYGQSNPDDPTEYNYIDLENKKYIEVGYIDNGVWTAKDDEIDISSYIDTNIIDIKENGTLTFTNTYDQAIPSSVDYYIPKEAFSNGN